MNISVLGSNWKSRDIDERQVYRYVNDYNISELLARIMIARGVEEQDVEKFLNPKIKDLLPDPFHLLDMEKACARVADGILRKERIKVLGDYDVDGATSSALLIRLLKSLDCDCSVYIPDRIEEGYGPSASSFQKFKDEGSHLVITVDCGITSFDAVNHANEIGLDSIILDHHLSDEKLPAAHAVVNPNRFDETTKFTYLAAVGVCFLFAVGLIKVLRAKNYFSSRPEPDLLKLLDIVALGTICDMMPIIGINRAFVVQGLKMMKARNNLGLNLLSQYGKIDIAPNTYHLGFVIGPRINAGGRVGKSYLGSHLLATDNIEQANKYALELERYNEERKILEQKVLDEALVLAENFAHKNYVIVSSDSWHQGIIGIAAGKLKERCQKPVLAIAFDGDIGKASCRSVRGIDLGRKIVDARNKGILLSGGGHAMAAGFTIHRSKMDEFMDYLDQGMDLDAIALEENNTRYYDANVSPNGLSLSLANELEMLEPYGNGNSEPVVRIDGLYVLKASVSNNRHVTCLLAPQRDAIGSKAIKSISFNSFNSPVSDALLSKKPLNLTVIGNLKANKWQGSSYPQLVILDVILN